MINKYIKVIEDIGTYKGKIWILLTGKIFLIMIKYIII